MKLYTDNIKKNLKTLNIVNIYLIYFVFLFQHVNNNLELYKTSKEPVMFQIVTMILSIMNSKVMDFKILKPYNPPSKLNLFILHHTNVQWDHCMLHLFSHLTHSMTFLLHNLHCLSRKFCAHSLKNSVTPR
jgi:hypothetical protein